MIANPDWLTEYLASGLDLPLARGVPIRALFLHEGKWIDAYNEKAVGKLVMLDSETMSSWGGHRHERVEDFVQGEHDHRVIVDLGDPLGFAYALQLEARVVYAALDPSCDWWAILGRWAHGETTDADRLAIVRALIEVFGV